MFLKYIFSFGIILFCQDSDSAQILFFILIPNSPDLNQASVFNSSWIDFCQVCVLFEWSCTLHSICTQVKIPVSPSKFEREAWARLMAFSGHCAIREVQYFTNQQRQLLSKAEE